jgi:hypothetical protein
MASTEKNPIRALPMHVTKDGFDFHQVIREGQVAVYRQTKAGTSIEDFEVILIQRRPGGIFQGKPFEARETYPVSEEWGLQGWTYQAKERAMAKFNALCERAKAA